MNDSQTSLPYALMAKVMDYASANAPDAEEAMRLKARAGKLRRKARGIPAND